VELIQGQRISKTSAGASSKRREDNDLPGVVFCCQISCCCQLALSPGILEKLRSGSTVFGGVARTELGSSPMTDLEMGIS
jgi:hypothetical protein